MIEVAVYLNETPGSAFLGYHLEAEWRLAWRFSPTQSIEPAATPIEIAEAVFVTFNHCEYSPAFYRDRTLSAGDVLGIQRDGVERPVFLCCQMQGWLDITDRPNCPSWLASQRGPAFSELKSRVHDPDEKPEIKRRMAEILHHATNELEG